MSPATRPRILCVDDEPLVLEGLRRHLERRFDLVTASCGGEGLVALEGGADFAVVISDMRMPGMDGAEFLSRVRTASPDSVRVLLTGHADFGAALAAVNQGQIFRFLTKPCPPDVVVATVDAAAEQHRLVRSERQLLEETLTGAVRALSDTLALANPVAFGRAARLHRTVAALCARLKVAERWPIEVAAQLSQLGCIQLPAAVAEKLCDGAPLAPAEQLLADRVPALADQLLARIPRLEPVREIVAAQGRRFDGADAPSAVRARGLPLGARMLKLAIDLDGLEAGGLSGAEALAVLQGRVGEYDPVLLEALEAEVGQQRAAEVAEVPLSLVKAGQVLAADVRSTSGVLLVARGYTVSQGLLMRLQNSAHAVKEPLRVYTGAARGHA